MADTERWRWVDGYEGLYMVSDLGRIMSVPRKTHFGHIMKLRENWAGYQRVNLCKCNERQDYSVHRLVATAFVENKGNKPEVNHINGNRSDNRADNLEWVTRSENERHAYGVLGKKPNKPWQGKPMLYRRKFSDEQVKAIRRDERSNYVIAAEYGVSKTAIRDIKRRKNYKEVV